jgi:hypothetical protein
LVSRLTSGQTMFDILKQLPKENFEEINIDSLIKNEKFYPASNSEEQIIRYTLTGVNETTGTLRIEMTFESGQRGFIIRELRRIKVTDNEFIIVYSVVNGAPIAFGQSELATYKLKRGQLTKKEKNLLPSNIGLADFVKPNTPDSVIAKYNEYSNHSYELVYSGDNICYVLHENIDSYDIDKSWLLGNKIEFIFEKGKFKRSSPFFSEE